MIDYRDFSNSEFMTVDQLPDPCKPLLLVDVDGVLNVSKRNPKPQLYDIHQVTTSDGFRFRLVFRKDLKEILKPLWEVFQPVWCTMWDHDANRCISPLLELEEWPVIPTFDHAHEYDTGASRYHHKIPMIEAHVGRRPFAWIDDEIGGWDNQWQDHRTVTVAPTLLHRIDQRSGVLPHNVAKLVAWGQRHSL